MISVIVPVYNESDNIDKFIDRLGVFDDEFEVIFSVSGDDDTFEKIKARGYRNRERF
ncbi:MAG: glycosyltransferase, partial [Finegoldia magna]|nr:glycosyltransferase [Finegoldia magna]